MKKWIPALLCMAAAGMIMSGCAARSTTSATTAPMATNSPMAAATIAPMTPMQTSETATARPMMPETSQSPAGMTDMTPAQAGKMAEQIAEAVERISEVDDAEVIVHGNQVLVAVEFDEQYSAGLDDRMKETIVKAVQQVDPNLESIEITDDGTLYGQIKSLGSRMAQATGLDELADDFGDLWNRVTGM